MAHQFQSGLFFGQSAWHGLGVTLPAESPVRYSIDDAITISGLDWAVETRPVCVDGKEIAGHKAIVRNDSGDVLGVVPQAKIVLIDQADLLDPRRLDKDETEAAERIAAEMHHVKRTAGRAMLGAIVHHRRHD